MRAILNKLSEWASGLSLELIGDFHKIATMIAVLFAVAATAAGIPAIMSITLISLLTGSLYVPVALISVWAGFVAIAAISVATLKLAQWAETLLD